MASELPDYVIGFMGANWKELGLVPCILWRLLVDRGYTREAIDDALCAIIGPDYAGVNLSEWIDRMVAKGNKDMIHSLEYDEPPVLDIMDDAIAEYLDGRE